MKGKTIFIVCLLSILIIVVFIVFSIWASRMDTAHSQVKEYFLEQLQQSIDNNEDGISYRTNRYQLNGVGYIGEIYVVNNKKDIKYIEDILCHCKALKEVRNYIPTNIHVFIGGINIGCTGSNGDYFWSGEDGATLGFYLSEDFNDKLWRFLGSLDYHTGDEVVEDCSDLVSEFYNITPVELQYTVYDSSNPEHVQPVLAITEAGITDISNDFFLGPLFFSKKSTMDINTIKLKSLGLLDITYEEGSNKKQQSFVRMTTVDDIIYFKHVADKNDLIFDRYYPGIEDDILRYLGGQNWYSFK